MHPLESNNLSNSERESDAGRGLYCHFFMGSRGKLTDTHRDESTLGCFMKKLIIYLTAILGLVNILLLPSLEINALAKDFKTVAEFISHLDSLANIPDIQLRDSSIAVLWNGLRDSRKIPFVLQDSVVFLYRGNANKVSWPGDFNGWNPNAAGFQGKKAGLSNIWFCLASFPLDARLDYKIVLNGSNWILDPENPYQQWSGFGPNSELRMPNWVYPEETIKRYWIPYGVLSENQNIYSVRLGYAVNYRVYVPAGYDSLSDLPSIYVTDGHEYADDKLGSMVIVLDNLIADGKIPPVMAVFIDPRNPQNPSQNRRASEYTMNEKYAGFVADELVPVIDSNYRTDSSPDVRAILGTSLGGINSAYFGVARHDKFRLIAIQSPAFKYKQQIYSLYQDSVRLPLKIFMSTGVIYDTEDAARQMKAILEAKGYPLKYIEVNEGHSWGNWRALLDEILIYFFSGNTKVEEKNLSKPEGYFLPINSYPNPFNSSAAIEFYLPKPQKIRFELFNSLGQRKELIDGETFYRGKNKLVVMGSGLSSGLYFYRIQTEDKFLTGKILLVK